MPIPHDTKTLTIGKMLADRAAALGDRTFVVSRGNSASYHELDSLSGQVANNLVEMGIKKHENVGLFTGNSIEALSVWFGLAKVGAVSVLVNPDHRGDLLTHIINHSEIETLVVESRYLDRLHDVADETERLKRLIVVPSEMQTTTDGATKRFETIPLADLLQGPSQFSDIDADPKNIAAMIVTSGTTGPSKLVMRSHRMFFTVAEQSMLASQLKEGEGIYDCLKLCHGVSITSGILPALILGNRVVLREGFSASKFWDEIKEYECSTFPTVGTILSILMNQPPSKSDRDNPIRVVNGSSPLNAKHHSEFESRFNLKYVSLYGLTEVGIVLRNSYDDRVPGSCGRPDNEYFEVSIFDGEDREVSANVQGEIVIRPRTPWSTMAGYYQDNDATLARYNNLWFHSGDLGYKDKTGVFYYVGRKKDVIRRRGENISSEELEAVINSHPEVLTSAAVGVPAELGEDEIAICVVLMPDSELEPEELIRHSRKRLSEFAVPRYVEFRGELPMTPSARVQKYKLRQEIPGPNTWDREQIAGE